MEVLFCKKKKICHYRRESLSFLLLWPLEKIHLTDIRILIDCKSLIGSFFLSFSKIPNKSQTWQWLRMRIIPAHTASNLSTFLAIILHPGHSLFFHISRNKSRKYPIIGNNLSEEIGEPKEKPYGTENKTIDSICTQSEHSMNKNSNNGKRK